MAELQAFDKAYNGLVAAANETLAEIHAAVEEYNRLAAAAEKLYPINLYKQIELTDD